MGSKSKCLRTSVYVLIVLVITTMSAVGQKVTEPPNWVMSWASSQQIANPRWDLPDVGKSRFALRQIVHLSLGGEQVRIRISNVFGHKPLDVLSVSVADAMSPESSKIQRPTRVAVTFNNHRRIVIPAGAEYVSDPIEFHAKPLSDVAITMRIEKAAMPETFHRLSNQTSYLIQEGKRPHSGFEEARKINHWYWLSGVEVARSVRSKCIVALGDSITDGHASGLNKNQRWPDDLAARLEANAKTRNVCVINEGIGGNQLLRSGAGPAAVARLDRDVFAQPGVRYVILLEGVNDIGMLSREEQVSRAENREFVRNVILGFKEIIEKAHSLGIRVYGGTIMPFGGNDYYHATPKIEADRHAINRWIRNSGEFDGVLDFDKLMRDPTHKDRLNPKYDSGDHIHPNPHGYRIMANAIPLSWFEAR